MAYKKTNWVKFGRQGETIEITVKDSNNSKIDFFRCNNNKDFSRIIDLLDNKYGFKKGKFDEEDELEFLKKEMNW